jgi:fatty acid desaturase
MCSDSTLWTVFFTWIAVIITSSFLYSVVAVNAGHHGLTITHDGDEIKSLDYGIYQMSATVDRIESNKNIMLALTHFGDHILHHMFPALDQAILPQLRNVFIETCDEFNADFRKWTLLYAAIQQFKQIHRQKPMLLGESYNKQEEAVEKETLSYPVRSSKVQGISKVVQ